MPLEEARAAEQEAAIFTRYLVGRPPPPVLVARYVEGNATLFAAVTDVREDAVVAFVRRHPWSVGLLDAAAGLVRPSGLLRGKILLMGAILETAPEFADEFLPRAVRPLALLARVVGHGLVAVGRALLGLPLWAAAARARA